MSDYLELSSYAQSYFSLMEKANANGHYVNVSTITLICVLNTQHIDLNQIVSTFNHDDVHLKVPPCKTETTKSQKKTFYNQITLNYRDISNKSIKIFSNGKLQITGLTCFFECKFVLEKIVRWLNEWFQTTDFAVVNAYVGMLNINFSVQHTIDLQSLNRLLNSYDNVMAVYNPETYPAINVKLQTSEFMLDSNPSISLFIFGTGNIVVSGTKTIEQSIFAYEFIVDVLNRTPSILRVRKERKIDSTTKFIDGYAARQYISCIGE